jgi:predicted nucleotidyltransferase
MQYKPLLSILSPYKSKLAILCQRYQVDKLYLFGSATTDRFTQDSDLDMIVRFLSVNLPPEDRGQLYWDLLAALEQLFDRKVDLLTDKKFDNPYFRQEVEKTKTLIYDQSQSAEVLV